MSATATASATATVTSTSNSCPIGTFASSSSPPCAACPAGYSTAAARSTSIAACSVCAPGFASSFTGAGGTTLTCTAICAAGSFALPGAVTCAPCCAGTYSLAGAAACTLCPAGTFGDRAGLTSAACSGACAACPAGSTRPDPGAGPTTTTCSAAGARAIPPDLGLQILPAAHPRNPRRVDLVIAPLAVCADLSPGGACATSPANAFVGPDGVTRFVVDSAAALHMSAGEMLACDAP